MVGESLLLDELEKTVNALTTAELIKFRRELKQRLPVVIDQAAQAAKAKKPEPKKTDKVHK